MDAWKADNKGKYDFSLFSVATLLHRKLFQKGSSPHGLLLVTGTTGSGKSQVARSLIRLRLKQMLREQSRNPHLVTFEDPIEAPLTSNPQAFQKRYGVDYTPREVGTEVGFDVTCLDHALKDALRQTPSVLFVGETRDRKDWDKLIGFAGTGHLVVTTSHAGSLSEAIGRILEAMEAYTPVARSVVASRLLGVIHVETVHYDQQLRSGKVRHRRATLPSMWRRTARSRMKLVSDGLSSVLPHRGDSEGMLGKAWFAEELALANSELGREALALDLRG